MHRRGGKRIRMDDPVPPEYEAPMTPMTTMTDNSVGEGHETPYPYTPYSQAPPTPAQNPTYVFEVTLYPSGRQKFQV